MRIVPNNILPLPGFLAVNFFGLLFVRKSSLEKLTAPVLNHEYIHTEQMKELWYIGFYFLYFFEWIYRLIFHTKTAYEGISFEREAYQHEKDLDYLKTRKRFAQWDKTITNK
jgi:hypothetical protein